MTFILGCYTDSEHPNGLMLVELDEDSGKMSAVSEYPVSNALYQAVSPDGRWLYTCTGGGLASFAVGNNARLMHVDEVALGKCACHVALTPEGGRVLFADYLGGFAGSVEVAEGRFGNVVRHQHVVGGPNLPRQDMAHCHQAIPTPDGKGYCVVDLGLDQIVEYPSGRIFRFLPAGAGPRHLLFHPNGRLAFLVCEFGNIVSSLSWSPAEGFKLIDTHSTISDPLSEKTLHPPRLCVKNNPVKNNQASAIRFTPDERRVVVSNRGENSLAVFDFDEATGKMSFRARTKLEGDWPRDFVFIGERLALVALERSGEVVSVEYDASEGTFREIGSLRGLYRPSSVCPLPTK